MKGEVRALADIREKWKKVYTVGKEGRGRSRARVRET